MGMVLVLSHAHAEDAGPLVGGIAALLDRGLVQHAEVVNAFLMDVLLTQIAAGDITPAAADRFFTLLDARLARPGGETPLSEAAQELIFEGEHLHHLGDEYGPSVGYIRQLTETILRRAEPLSSP